MLLAGTANAQRGYYHPLGSHAYHQGAWGQHHYRGGYRPYYPPHRYRPERRSSNHDAGVAIGALVIGGILGYAISQANQPRQPDATYYYDRPVAPQSYGYSYGTIAPQRLPAPAPVTTWQPAPQHPDYQPSGAPVYETRVVNGKTYFRPAR
ncbi:hypothetical protein AAV94_10275 [Lampropedia cohaerens]|uniref:Uncharacterized protein n=1 Tax=Lampropedia cohaerens TaxID=1610491 RepID=A0A0U1PYC5_9BURK|nr:hypothetical protein AAV94_10275 [Lampropedia cohaerens]